MYEKQLYGRKVLYFQYAPPMTQLDDCSDDALDNRPNPPIQERPALAAQRLLLLVGIPAGEQGLYGHLRPRRRG